MHTYALSIAGLDPSAGAGLLADIKTFEQLGVYGLGLCSALTVQHENKFRKLQWTRPRLMLEQLDLLFDQYEIGTCKIGIVESWEVLRELTDFLKSKNSAIQIVVDPVLRATAGFDFHTKVDSSSLAQWLDQVDLLTPNHPELLTLSEAENWQKAAKKLATHSNILAKGGHRKDEKGVDYLYLNNGQIHRLERPKGKVSDKHGSGCVLSSAIAAELAKGQNLLAACKAGKQYISRFLGSSEGLLGVHRKAEANDE